MIRTSLYHECKAKRLTSVGQTSVISLENGPISMEKPTRGSAMGEQIFAEEMKNFGNQVNWDRVDKLMRKYQFYSQDKAFKDCQQA